MQQNIATADSRTNRILLPQAPILVMEGHQLFCLSLDGELETITLDAAKKLLRQHMPIVCHAPLLARKLGMEKIHAYDVLELFAFVHAGKFTVPTPRGMARTLNLLEPAAPEDQCLTLRDTIRHLLVDLAASAPNDKSNPAALAAMMGLEGQESSGWAWTPIVLAALARTDNPPTRGEIKTAMKVWEKLPEWSIHAPEAPAGHHGVDKAETAERLQKLLQKQHKETRPQQQEYAQMLSHAFAPRDEAERPHVVLAEAGTGVGKTLGYLSPATLWAEKNGGAVWVSTYTRNLQRQVETELDRLYDDSVTKSRKVVTRKGRENYLCLLNLEDVTQSPAIANNELNAIALGLILRWVAVTEDGDFAGKDFSGWLVSLLGWNRVHSFADRRGECIYTACPHFNKCYIEKSVRKAKRADIVIANHALIMHQTSMMDADLNNRYIFDEGHHIFDAADSTYAYHLDGKETSGLRRWILGMENSSRSRARGIKRRLEDIIAGDEEAVKALDAVIEAAHCLPSDQWRQRLQDNNPKGVTESFLAICRGQVLARNKDSHQFYSLEAPVEPPIAGLFEAAYALSLRLNDLKRPMLALMKFLQNLLEDEAETLETDAKDRIRSIMASLDWRIKGFVVPWIEMLTALRNPPSKEYIDWLEIARIEGRDDDVGLHRAVLDPAAVFAEKLAPHAHGVIITSATLRDISPLDSDGWKSPLIRTGADHLAGEGGQPLSFHVESPFDYKNQTRIIIVNDVKKTETDEVAAAYRALFLASGGGALGIFTAVQRLKSVHEKIIHPLEKKGMALYAQHIDQLDISTLIDIFREEENACLLGTDATRDGIDVPGRSLRLVVYDRVPWTKPTILHKARRAHFGESYDDMLTRFKLKQAYGRLIRRHDDKGVFVMLDSALPSRLLSAFPEGVSVERIGLAEAVKLTQEFLTEPL
jgi:ATP-dependent DNA helicase DinG